MTRQKAEELLKGSGRFTPEQIEYYLESADDADGVGMFSTEEDLFEDVILFLEMMK